MSHFLQLHTLTVYPPSSPNRDGSQRPKSALYGGVMRLRLSSQSVKRAVRVSDIFRESLGERLSTRSRRFGEEVYRHLLARKADKDIARQIARQIASIFGKPAAGAGNLRISQIAAISPDEAAAALALAEEALAQGGLSERQVQEAAGQVLRITDSAVDLAMFGRMFADAPQYNRLAAVQVAHAITTHAAPEEEDLQSAGDDLGGADEHAGAAFLGPSWFGSGVFYQYAAVEVTRLVDNLGGDHELARAALSALARALALVSPSGKRSAFAHNVWSSYVRAEAGSVQPRSLASAFLHPVDGGDLMRGSITRLQETALGMDRAYGAAADSVCEMDVTAGMGTLDDIAQFAGDQAQHA